MSLTVVVRSGAAEADRRLTFDSPRVVIGRSRGCEVRLPDPSVSQRHASIQQRGSDYLIFDEGSTNGTFVGPVRLATRAPRVLGPSEVVRVGRIWLELRVEPAAAPPSPASATQELALALIADAMRARGEEASVRVLARVADAPTGQLVLEDVQRGYVVGRQSAGAESAGVDLALPDGDLSRRHLELRRRGERIMVRDLGSKNGTRLDGERLPADREVAWHEGQRLVAGQTELTIEDPLRRTLSELEAQADEILGKHAVIEGPNEPVESDTRGEPPPSREAADRAPSALERASTSGSARALAPTPPGRRPSGPAVTGWSATDLLVACLALVVLGLSALGLFWLLHG